MKIRTIILSLILLLPFVPSMAQEQDDEQFMICHETTKPRFNGGDADEFSKWVHEHKIYPEEAIRVIESAPQIWKPGLNYKGEPIDVNYTFPVLFSLPKE